MTKGCPKCGRIINENTDICPYCNYDLRKLNKVLVKIDNEEYVSEKKYAGFIKRIVSALLDTIILLIIIISIIFMFNIKKNMYWIFIPIFVLIDIFGNSILERTSFRGSIGKKIVGIEVTDEYENPETFSIALMRNIVKYLNLLTFGIGFIMCLGNKKKQTLSDKITKTYVINKINFNSEEKKDYASIFKRLTAFIIDIIFLIILNYIIIYAINYLTVNFKLSHNINELKYVIVIFTNLIYFPFNESKRGKTIGKKYMKIRVTDKNENTNSFIILFIRQLLIIIDIISLGFLLPFVNEEKQTIKDKITKTIVIND